jgi:hypothetical protein
MTPSGIDPATFLFVAQCLKHSATACTAEDSGHCLVYIKHLLEMKEEEYTIPDTKPRFEPVTS